MNILVLVALASFGSSGQSRREQTVAVAVLGSGQSRREQAVVVPKSNVGVIVEVCVCGVSNPDPVPAQSVVEEGVTPAIGAPILREEERVDITSNDSVDRSRSE